MKPRTITSQRIIGKWGLAAAFIFGIATFYTTGFYQLISWETVAQNYSKISNFIEQNRATSYLGFGIFYIAVVAFSLPIASLLTMAAGALLGCVLMALMMANAGGAWDNAKKHVEKGNLGGKGSDVHAAVVVGDTVGDPFKDTSGPSMNILINVMAIVSLVIAPML